MTSPLTVSSLSNLPEFSPPRHHRHHSAMHRQCHPLTTPRKAQCNPFVARAQLQHSEKKKENFLRKRTTSLHTINIDSLATATATSTSVSGGVSARHGYSRSVIHADRFIPKRPMDLTIRTTAIDSPLPLPSPVQDSDTQPLSLSQSPVSSPTSATVPLTPSQRTHNRAMAEIIFSPSHTTARTLTFSQSNNGTGTSAGTGGGGGGGGGHSRTMSMNLLHDTSLRAQYYSNLSSPITAARSPIITTAERVLDAPQLTDDYYLNLLDWSSTNLVAIALGCACYVWNSADSSIDIACDFTDRGVLVTSVKWHSDGAKLAVGCDDSTMLVIDVIANKRLSLWRNTHHSTRVGSLCWSPTLSLLTSGGRDGMIAHHDVRQRDVVSEWLCHDEEVCGLAWSHDGQSLASGGNDNACLVFDRDNSQPRHRLTYHTAAVKALAWCPFTPHILATGGGSNDRHIRIVHTVNGQQLHSIDTKAQVCSLQWSQHSAELLSSHGFSINALCLWRYPTLTPIAQFEGHSARVLHTAVSPDGTTVCSAAADETLRFWKVWERAVSKQGATLHQRGRSAALTMTSPLAQRVR